MSAPDPQSLAADPEINAFVTANAGSGKTTTLVNRVARLLLRGVDPETVLCVTYTKAAAAEMQRRLFDQLGDWALMPDEILAAVLLKLEGGPYAPERLTVARKLFAKALETPGGLKIQTIHAFCEKLLRRFPLEAGVSPGFQVLEDASAAQVAAEARDGVARRALAGEPILAEAYARFAVALDFASFEAMFATFETRREAIGAYIERCGGLAGVPAAVAEACGLPHLIDAEAVERAAMADLPVALWRAGAAALQAGGTRDQKCASQMAEVATAAEAGEADFKAALGVFCTAAGEPAKWLETAAKLKADPALQQRLFDERDRLIEADAVAKAARAAEDSYQALILAFFYGRAYAEAKARRGALDFTDLIGRTQALLTGTDAAAWVLYKLDAGLEHILVDEAQDTAPEQWAILRALSGEFFAGAGPDPYKRERRLDRSIFVVGDEKQSIFSFQGAAPERLRLEQDYFQAMATGAGRRFAPVPLLESWRSTREVLGFVDAVFAPDELRQALQPRREGAVGELITHISNRAKADPEGLGTIDLWPLEREPEQPERSAWDEPLDAEAGRGAYRRLAEKIADEIKVSVERGEAVHDRDTRAWRPAGYGDVLILVRKRKVLFEELLRACKRRGVPVAGADRLVLSEHPVFEDFLALARFVLFPDHDLGLAALLRSPFCDVDEDGLYALARNREAPLWRALVRRREERPEWAAAADFLSWARTAGTARTPFDFYGRVLNRLDGAGRSMRTRLVTRLGPEAGDAIEEFLAQALAAEARGVMDLERFADALAGLTVSVKREMDEPRGEVRIMTAHGAKGLEAPIVFLPETVGAGPARGSPLLATEDGGFLWCASAGADCEATAAARAWRKRREEDEALRLLYVALTRARDRLVIAGRINARAKEETVKGWWAPMCAAFEHPALAERVKTVRVGEMEVRRFGSDPRLMARSAADAAPPPAPLPDWALRPVEAEAAAMVYAAPSTLLEDVRGPAPSPLGARGGMGRFRRGTLIHRLLQLLPDLEPAERAAGAMRLLAKEPDLTDEQRAEMAAAALGVLDDPAFAEVFAPGSRAEAAVAGGSPELPAGLAVAGRVDRMRITPDRVLVVDFKTNRPAPERIEDADPSYVLQMAVYAAVLRAIFPQRRVEAALVWTDGPRLMPVPEAVMAAALAGLERSS